MKIRDYARHIGVDPQTVRNWIKRGMPCKTKQYGLVTRVSIEPKIADKWVAEQREMKNLR